MLAIALLEDMLADIRVQFELLRAHPDNLPMSEILDAKHFTDGQVCTHFYLRCEFNGRILVIDLINLRDTFKHLGRARVFFLNHEVVFRLEAANHV